MHLFHRLQHLRGAASRGDAQLAGGQGRQVPGGPVQWPQQDDLRLVPVVETLRGGHEERLHTHTLYDLADGLSRHYRRWDSNQV